MKRELISKRTKDALKASKKKLGNPQNLTKEAARMGRTAGVKARQARADEYAERMKPVIQGLLDEGLSLEWYR